MTRSAAKRILLTRHGEMKAIADKLGFSRQYVSDVLAGLRKSDAILSAAVERATEIQAERLANKSQAQTEPLVA